MARRSPAHTGDLDVPPKSCPKWLWEQLSPVERLWSLAKGENDYRDDVRKHAKRNGWLVYFVYDPRRSPPGWPDLHALKGGREIVAELKMPWGKVSEEQADYLAAFAATERVEVYVWTPLHWDEIYEVLGCR